MNIAVVDAGGNLVAHVRMDEAWLGSIDISMKKAFTSRAFDIATKDLAAESQPGRQFFGIHASNDGRVMIFAGGVPLERDGKVEFIRRDDLVSVPFNVSCGRYRNCAGLHTGVCLSVNPARPGGAQGYVDMGGWVSGQAGYVPVPPLSSPAPVRSD